MVIVEVASYPLNQDSMDVQKSIDTLGLFKLIIRYQDAETFLDCSG